MDKDFNRSDRILTLGGKCYRLQRYIEKTEKDIHHLISRKLIQKYNVNHELNKVKMYRREHVALNQFFWDKQNPRDQFKKIFELVKPVLSEWVRKELYTILYMTDDKMFYTSEVLKWQKKKESLKNWNHNDV